MLYYNDTKEEDKDNSDERSHKHYVYVGVKKESADEISKQNYSGTLEKLEEDEEKWEMEER
jgi:hypothetical protein